MMIKFSWEKINNKFGWNAYSVLEYFFLKQGLKSPPYLRTKIPEKVKKEAMKPYPPGACYIENINGLLRAASDPNDLYLYLELASLRNVFDYHMRGSKHLPWALVPEYARHRVHYHPLLTINKDGNVEFKY